MFHIPIFALISFAFAGEHPYTARMNRLKSLRSISVSLVLSSLVCAETVNLTDREGRSVRAEVLSLEDGQLSLRRESDNREFKLDFDRLSTASQLEVEHILGKSDADPEGGRSGRSSEIPDDLPKKLYPMSLKEIEEGLESIAAREKDKDWSEGQYHALRDMNCYRFLCHVSDDADNTRRMNTEATAAAQACEDAGTLSHDLGSWTDKCNLHYTSAGGPLEECVEGFVNDSGDNNRERRGHRAHLLHASLADTGFGISKSGQYMAMWALDRGGRSARDHWSYPGAGLYPLSYLKGNSWSLYLTHDAPAAKDLEVQVTRLNERPEREIRWSDEPEGERLPVPWVSTYKHVINFEPTQNQITEPGIYWVRIKGGGVKEQYLVELFNL